VPVDDDLDPEALQQRVPWPAGGRRYPGPASPRQLHEQVADAARRAVHEHPLSR
jgi:hypothetical protein